MKKEIMNIPVNYTTKKREWTDRDSQTKGRPIKRNLCILLLLLVVSLLSPFANAGIFDWLKEKVKLSPSAETNVRLEVGNAAPTITFIESIPNVNLAPAPQTTNVIFTSSAQDPNGVNDLNDATASASFVKGAVIRTASCVFLSSNPTEKTYQCTATINYYDESGIWDLTVSINDLAGSTAQGSSTFQLNLLRDISISPAVVSFPSVVQGQTNVIALSNTEITNNGNAKIPETSTLELTASNLLGETTPSENIPAVNFNSAPDSAVDVCDSAAGGATQLAHLLATQISGIILPSGPSGSSSEQISYCITLVPSSISSQFYSTSATGGQPWTITIN